MEIRKIRMYARGFAVAILLFCLDWSSAIPARADDLPESALPANAQYYKYEHGRIAERREVHRGEPILDRLVVLLRDNLNGWVADTNTYVPNLLFRSQDIDINCRNDLVVINLKRVGSDQAVQLSKGLKGCARKILSTDDRAAGSK